MTQQVATQGSGCQGDTGPLYLIDYVPQDRVLLAGVPVATRASRIGPSEVQGGNDRILITNRFPVVGEGDPVKGPLVTEVINQGTSDRVLMS